jgi:hypothetical protein
MIEIIINKITPTAKEMDLNSHSNKLSNNNGKSWSLE